MEKELYVLRMRLKPSKCTKNVLRLDYAAFPQLPRWGDGKVKRGGRYGKGKERRQSREGEGRVSEARCEREERQGGIEDPPLLRKCCGCP
jgi:hypothetical protein